MMAMNSQTGHILVLEDEPAQRDVLIFNLAEAGFRVAATAEAAKAFKLAQYEHFDLILVDYYLPDHSGADFVQWLRQTDEYRHVPMIMLTARERELNLDYLQNDLALLVLPKPCSMPRLVEVISERLTAAPAAS
jgi:CheY-like chemotaxis protein